MRVIGLTGGIASGKSTAAEALRRLGAPVVDADELAHRAIAPGGAAYEAVREAFGDEVVGPDGTIDRKRLGRLVFRDPEARRRLESIVHPAVSRALAEWVEAERARGAPAVVLVIPLLVETGWDRRVDEVWVVDVPEDVQIARLRARDGLEEEEARRRVRAQAPRAVRLRAATRVFRNEGEERELQAAIAEAWRAVVGA
ncbi:MAG: dephospho-CoA kinase [Clostridia bacterium]|nr:dephospho-CoA kinase [Clostridia bacterium]